MENIVTVEGENLKLASGGKFKIIVGVPYYLKVTFNKIKILEDTDYFSGGDFLLHALVDGVDVGLTGLKPDIETGKYIDYEYSVAIKHLSLDNAGNENPLIVEFRADELERGIPYVWQPKNKEVARFKNAWHEENDNFWPFGVGEHELTNEYLKLSYLIEEISKDEFEAMEIIEGKVFSMTDDGKNSVKAQVRIFDLADGKLVKRKFTNDDGAFEFSDLDIDARYRLYFSAKGHSYSTLDMCSLHQYIQQPLSKTYFSGEVVHEETESVLADVRVDTYKTMLKLPKELVVFKEAGNTISNDTLRKLVPLEIASGIYIVAETRNQGADSWARIHADTLPPGGGWICYKSGTQKYGQMNDDETNVQIAGLNCFEGPSTGRPIKTDGTETKKLPIGDYPVADIKKKNDAYYVKVTSDHLPFGKGWICSQWQDDHYAFLYDEMIKEEAATTNEQGAFRIEVGDYQDQLYKVRFVLKNYFDSEIKVFPNETRTIKLSPAEKTILESSIITRLSDFNDFSYNKTGAHYPYSLPDVNIQVAGAIANRKNNCCTFVEGLLVKAWKDALGSEFSWGDDEHDKMMITESPVDYYSPVTAAVESNMGIEIDDVDKLPPPWTIMQGWKSQWKGGHTFLIVDCHQSTQRILTLESNAFGVKKCNNCNTKYEKIGGELKCPNDHSDGYYTVYKKIYKMNGPGFRKLGDIDDFTNYNPGSDWWKDAGLWNWSTFKTTYPYRKMARLKVYDLKWVTSVVSP